MKLYIIYKFVLIIFLSLLISAFSKGQTECFKTYNGKEYVIEFTDFGSLLDGSFLIGDKFSKDELAVFIQYEKWKLGEVDFKRSFRSVAKELLTEKQLLFFLNRHESVSYGMYLDTNAKRIRSYIFIGKKCFDKDGKDPNKLSFPDVIRLKEAMDKIEIIIGNPSDIGNTEKYGYHTFTTNALLYK